MVKQHACHSKGNMRVTCMLNLENVSYMKDDFHT